MSKNLFFIDDDSIFLRLITRACKKIEAIESYETAGDGEEALEKLKHWLLKERALPDIFLVDINMLKINGFEFLDQVKILKKQHKPLQNGVSFFMLTSSLHDSDREKAYETGIINGFLQKPFGKDGFESLLKNLVE